MTILMKSGYGENRSCWDTTDW